MLAPGTHVWNVIAAREFHRVSLTHLSWSLICWVWQAVVFPWSSCCFAPKQELFLTFPTPFKFPVLTFFGSSFASYITGEKKKPSHQMALIPPSSLHPDHPHPLFGTMRCLSISFSGLDVSREIEVLTSLHPPNTWVRTLVCLSISWLLGSHPFQFIHLQPTLICLHSL